MMPFSDEDIYAAVNGHLPAVSTYVDWDTLLGVKDSIDYIELIGTCHGSVVSLMTTKMVVQKEFRRLIHPELNIVNDDGTLENTPPEGFIKASEPEIVQGSDEGWIEKIKRIF